jgi:hypothetical protein
MTTIHLQVAPRVGPAHPRGSRLAAAVFLALWRGAAALVHSAAPRAREVDPDTRAVRELAMSFRDSDPGYAADLSAAADRHEQLQGRCA